MSERPHIPEHALRPEAPGALRRLYLELDQAIGELLRARPEVRCVGGCADCCRTAAPLVSEAEFALIDLHLDTQVTPEQRARVVERARARRAELEAGAPDDFCCPLLEAGRCVVYASRPYLCRSFGHSARTNQVGLSNAYTCQHLRAALDAATRAGTPAPTLAFRGAAIRERVTGGELVDSYLPIWLSTTRAQRKLVWRDDRSAVVVAAEGCRVAQQPDVP